MNDDTNRNSDQQADISKSQSAQQPQAQSDQARSGQLDESTTGQSDGSTTSQSSGSTSGMADYGSAESADAMNQNRTDVEGSSLNAEPTDQNGGGFVGSDSQSDTSSELIEDEDSQAPAGK